MARLRGRRYFHRVLGLFLAASLLPMVALSVALTGVAASALLRSSERQGRAAAEAFALRLTTLLDAADASLGLIASSPEALSSLDAGPDPSAYVGRLLAQEAAREPGLSYALVASEGPAAYSTRPLPRDWDPRAYSGWGILRTAADARTTVFGARRRVVENGDIALIVGARALRDGAGTIKGYALAEVDRSALVGAAKGGEGLAADFEVLQGPDLVAFSFNDQSREGRYLDEAPPAGRPTAAAFESRAEAGRGFLVRAYLPANLLSELLGAMRETTLSGVAACAVLALALAYLASRIVTRPVLALSAAMGRLREGDLAVRLEPAGQDELGDLMASFNDTAATLDGLMRDAAEGQDLLRAAELKSLAAQMNPHFLYNALNSIRSLARLGQAEDIVAMATGLGKLLRASARSRDEVSTVGAGLALVREYLAIEAIRFGQRFAFTWLVEDTVLGMELPSLVLEPLAENALTHGLERQRGAGSLRIEARLGGGEVLLAFEDDGPGMEAAALADLQARLARADLDPAGRNLGLLGTNRRLRLRYGAASGVTVALPSSGRGFRAELRLPARPAPAPLEGPAGPAGPGEALP